MPLKKVKKNLNNFSQNDALNITSCGIVLFRNEQGKRFYLLLCYQASHIDFSKGHREKGEALRETALRELKEETGINKVELIEGFCERISYFFNFEEKRFLKQVFFFLGKTTEKKITLSYEHQDAFWLTYKQALQKLTFQNTKNVLAKAEKFLKIHFDKKFDERSKMRTLS